MIASACRSGLHCIVNRYVHCPFDFLSLCIHSCRSHGEMTVLSVRQEPTRPGHQNRVTIHYLTLKTLKWSAGDLIVLPATGDAPESVWKVWPSLQGDKETITFATALDTLPETLDTSTARRVLSSSTAAAKAPTSSVVCRVSGDDAKVVADVTEDVLTLWKEILCTSL